MNFLSSRSPISFSHTSLGCRAWNVNFITSLFFVETAMGQHVNAQGNKDSDYVKAVYEYDFVFCFEISMARGEIF
jgi:hypothetical protein